MKWKHLFIDLDGTTIPSHPDAIPSIRVIQAIHVVQKYIRVSVATGRPLYRCRSIIEQLGICDLCIISSGIQLYDSVKKKIVHEHSLPPKILEKALTIVQEHDLPVYGFNGNGDIKVMNNILPDNVLSIYITKISEERAKLLKRQLSSISEITMHIMPSWEDKTMSSLEICSANSTKLHRVHEICSFLGIKESECIAVGDGLNDYDMLMAAGLKIAMGNAHPDLKKIADIIAPSVEEDGLAVVLEKILLK